MSLTASSCLPACLPVSTPPPPPPPGLRSGTKWDLVPKKNKGFVGLSSLQPEAAALGFDAVARQFAAVAVEVLTGGPYPSLEDRTSTQQYGSPDLYGIANRPLRYMLRCA